MWQSLCSKSKTELSVTFSLQVLGERNLNIFLSIILCVFVCLLGAKFDYQTPRGMFLPSCILYPSSKLASLYIYSVTWSFWTHFPAKIIFQQILLRYTNELKITKWWMGERKRCKVLLLYLSFIPTVTSSYLVNWKLVETALFF